MYMSITVIKIKDKAKKWARVPLCKSIRENRQKARRNIAFSNYYYFIPVHAYTMFTYFNV